MFRPTKYIDSGCWIYFVRSGIGPSTLKTFYKRPERSGANGCRMTEWRSSIKEAQMDLDEFAK